MCPTCRICASRDLIEIIDLGEMPVAHRLLESQSDTEMVHPLTVHCCTECGLAQITDPLDPALLYLDYNYCFSSWKPEPHMEDEVRNILGGAGDGSVFEIGCNDGSFLEALRRGGAGRLVGLEPNPFAGRLAGTKGFTIYNSMLDESVASEVVRKFGKFETVVARQVLEHLTDLQGFFRCADTLIQEDGFLFVDVPDFETALSMGDCSMLWEEHCNYFTEFVLRQTLQRFGYEPQQLWRYNFSGGTIAVLAKRMITSSIYADHETLTARVGEFAGKVARYRHLLGKTLEKARRKGFAVVIYGVGCRACTLVNGLKLANYIDSAIDDQPERQGKYMPGSRLPIKSLRALERSSGPLVCLLAVNQENEPKVKAGLDAILEGRIECASLLTPNDIWNELQRLSNNLDS